MAIIKLNSRAIPDDTVVEADIADGSVTSAKLDTNISVTGDFTADSTNATLFVDASTNRVHIGGGTSDTNTSALSVRKSGGGNFIANFENTSTTAPYGVMVRDPSGSAAGYPLLQVSNSGGNHYFRVDSNTGKNYFAPGGTEKVRIDSDGLKFNGDTAAANALDDYEEGTFTPTLTGEGACTITLSTALGQYNKVGRIVNVTMFFQVSAVSGGSSSLAVILGGLPFATNTNLNTTGAVRAQNMTNSASSLWVNIFNNDTNGRIEEWNGANAGNLSDHITSSTNFAISATYSIT